MVTLIKGRVLKKRSPLMQIKLINGRRFWTDNRQDADVRDFVWVAWNYTEDGPAQILSKNELKNLRTEHKEQSFSDPMSEDFGDFEVLSSEDEQWLEQINNNEDAPEHEVRSFSGPMSEEIEDTEWEVRSFSDPCV